MSRNCSLLLIAAVQAFTCFSAWGQTACSPPPSDTAIEPTIPAGCSTGQLSNDCTFQLTNARVVGPGTSSELTSDGQLLFPDIYVANNVVSQYAKVYISLFHDFVVPEGGWAAGSIAKASVYLNGQFVGAPAITNTGYQCLVVNNVPIQDLRFAHRVDQGGPGENTVEIKIEQTVDSDNGGQWLASASVNAITFQAMAPILMLHGIRVSNTTDAFAHFEQAFQQAKLPYMVGMFAESDIRTTGDQTVLRWVNRTLALFGAQHVHIIGHSAGGVWAREFLANALPENVGVYSLTTLSTPHHGSVLADIAFALHGSPLSTRDPSGIVLGPTLIFRNFVPDSPSTPELTVERMAGFNVQNVPSLPGFTTVSGQQNEILYATYEADANTDHSVDTAGFGTITCPPDECAGYRHGVGNLIPEYLYHLNQAWQSVSLGKDSGGRSILVGAPSTQAPYPLNDLAVTANSATLQDLIGNNAEFLYADRGILGKNHHTILGTDLGAEVAAWFTSGQMQAASSW